MFQYHNAGKVLEYLDQNKSRHISKEVSWEFSLYALKPVNVPGFHPLRDFPRKSTGVYFLPFFSALAAFFLSVPRNFLLRFFLCFRCCLDGFSIFVATPILTFL